jgi:hypothetical protein
VLQPDTLAQKFLKSKTPCKLASRLLFAMPPVHPRGWTDDEVDDSVAAGYAAILSRLQALPLLKKVCPDDDPNGKMLGTESQATSPAAGDRSMPFGFHPQHAPDGWKDPREVVGRILRRPRVAGSNTREERSDVREQKKKELGTESQATPPPGTPTFDDLARIVVELCPASHERLENFAFGAGWGRGIIDDGLYEFWTTMQKYLDFFGQGDPRDKQAVEETSHLVLTCTAEQARDLVPEVISISADAKTLFARFVDGNACEQLDADEILFPWFANLPGQAARLALVLHLARWAAGEDVDPAVCDAVSMKRGLRLARWFGCEARRVISEFSFTEEQREDFRLIDWLSRRGGVATVRDLSRSNGRKYPTSEAAQAALDRLAETGVGVWIEWISEANGFKQRALSLGRGHFEPLSQDGESSEESEISNLKSQIPDADRVGHEARNTSDAVTSNAASPKAQPARTVSDSSHTMSTPASAIEQARVARPKGKRWTIQELAAADPRETLSKDPGN